MSRRIRSKRDLPKEFNLNKYNSLKTMSDKDLFRQLYWRINWKEDSWSNELSTYFLEHGDNLPAYESDPFNEIKVELPDWYYEQFKGGRAFCEEYAEKIQTSKALSTGYGIGYLTRFEVMGIAQCEDLIGERKGKPFIISDDEAKELIAESEVNHGTLTARLSDSVSIIMGESLYISLDLSVSDEILIDDFRKLLPVWRKELGIESDNTIINNTWSVIRRKLIEYNVLPYIDLMLWSRTSCLNIPNGVLAVALFPDGDKDGFALAQTVKPFVEKIMTYDSLEKIKRELSKDS